MDMMDQILVIRVNYITDSYLFNYSENHFCQAAEVVF